MEKSCGVLGVECQWGNARHRCPARARISWCRRRQCASHEVQTLMAQGMLPQRAVPCESLELTWTHGAGNKMSIDNGECSRATSMDRSEDKLARW